MKPTCIAFVLLCVWLSLQIKSYSATTDSLFTSSPSNGNYRLIVAASANVVAFSGTLLLLDQLWYQQYPRTSFHFHNDLNDWKQMDKLGHTVSSYQFSQLSYYSFRWANLDNRQSALWGGLSGTLIISTIEILDGFSAQWGFSWADMGANLLGSASFLSQQLLWEEQKIKWKYSYSRTGIEQYRPEMFGSTLAENLIKDYNGHTFWISANLSSLFGLPDGFPKWLNLAIGHGASGMLGSESNPEAINDALLPRMPRYRQWYIAPDIALSRIETGSEFLNNLLSAIDLIKFPTPTLEFNSQNKWEWHWIFF